MKRRQTEPRKEENGKPWVKFKYVVSVSGRGDDTQARERVIKHHFTTRVFCQGGGGGGAGEPGGQGGQAEGGGGMAESFY